MGARATRSASSTSTIPTATSGWSPGSYRVHGSKKHVLPDVVAFVNGLPLAVIECKSPTIGDAWKAEAVKQLHRYQEADSRWKDQGAPKLFEAAQILVGTCGERAVYGTVGTLERFFLEWKEPYPLTVVAARPSSLAALRRRRTSCSTGSSSRVTFSTSSATSWSSRSKTGAPSAS